MPNFQQEDLSFILDNYLWFEEKRKTRRWEVRRNFTWEKRSNVWKDCWRNWTHDSHVCCFCESHAYRVKARVELHIREYDVECMFTWKILRVEAHFHVSGRRRERMRQEREEEKRAYKYKAVTVCSSLTFAGPSFRVVLCVISCWRTNFSSSQQLQHFVETVIQAEGGTHIYQHTYSLRHGEKGKNWTLCLKRERHEATGRQNWMNTVCGWRWGNRKSTMCLPHNAYMTRLIFDRQRNVLFEMQEIEALLQTIQKLKDFSLWIELAVNRIRKDKKLK